MEKEKVVLDLSKWNEINNYSLFADGIDGVILRIGYRSYGKGEIIEDNKFKTHLEGLRRAKTPIGVYFFTTAINEAEAAEEAEWVVDRIKKYNITLSFPIAIDTEYSNNNKNGRSDKLNKMVRTNCVIAFCRRIQELGYRPMIYASDSWFVSKLDYPRVRGMLKWVARYSTEAPEKATDCVAGWQRTNSFDCKGTNKGVDMSSWYYPIHVKAATLSGNTAPKVEEEKKDEVVIVAGDKVPLTKEPLYISSTAEISRRALSGTYYFWDNVVKNGRIRITSKKEYVGVMGKVTGWIKVH